jgi:hypothetical protein
MTRQQKITDALKFWELARLVYNLMLAATALYLFRNVILQLPMEAWAGMTVMAVLANIAYGAAYAPDIFVQSSDFAPLWRQYRRCLLWGLGMFVAFVLTRVIVWSEQALAPSA